MLQSPPPTALSPSHSSNQEIQTYAIALINALFLKAPEDKRQVGACSRGLAGRGMLEGGGLPSRGLCLRGVAWLQGIPSSIGALSSPSAC